MLLLFIAYILLILTILLITGCRKTLSPNDYIKEKINIDISNCIVIRDIDNRNIFNLGETIIEANCKYDKEKIENQLKEYNKLPLSENINKIMYDEQQNYKLGINNKIPEITNGYYFIIDRYNKKEIKYNDENLLKQASLKFTLVLYDIDTSTFYYLEYDK